MTGSDPLRPDDLTSARKTRQASHREFIKRRPRQYYRSTLARRLGVSRRTVQRYDLALEIRVTPIYTQQPITWDTLNTVPDFSVGRLSLQDERGKRYPALREIAARLLTQGHRVALLSQQANHYSLDPPQVSALQVQQIQQTDPQRIAVQQGRLESIPPTPTPPGARPRSGLPPPEQPGSPLPVSGARRQTEPPKPKPAPRLTKRRARQPLPDAYQEALARRVYQTLNDRASDPGQRISLASARRAVFTYGVKMVLWALGLTQHRHNVMKPVGFFMTVLRSESKNRNSTGFSKEIHQQSRVKG
jgi:hypothetical protein